MNIDSLVRDNIRSLKPYSSARHEFEGTAEVYLDANESPYPSGTNRYPDPLQKELKQKIALVKGVDRELIFLGNGSDEGIDLLIRIFCRPGYDRIMILPPTYGMYEVSAAIADIEVIKIPLNDDFQPDTSSILSSCDSRCKILFLCSPNNPTGTLINANTVEVLLREFPGIVVLDEAYVDFSSSLSWTNRLSEFNNLVVLQTFSKAWGLAGIRLGIVCASKTIIGYLNKVKPPYNVNILTQKHALKALDDKGSIQERISVICRERMRLENVLSRSALVEEVFASEANFLLVRFKKSPLVFRALKEDGVVVRDRSSAMNCANCLRITVGLREENDRVLQVLNQLT